MRLYQNFLLLIWLDLKDIETRSIPVSCVYFFNVLYSGVTHSIDNRSKIEGSR
jgi:hypothetical protein